MGSFLMNVLYPLEKYVFFCSWLDCYINAKKKEKKKKSPVHWFYYLFLLQLVDFLFPLILLINESSAWITECWGHRPKCNCGFVYFSFHLRQISFSMLWRSIIRCTIHIPDFSVFLLNWFYYCHVMSLSLSLSMGSAVNFILSDVHVARYELWCSFYY